MSTITTAFAVDPIMAAANVVDKNTAPAKNCRVMVDSHLLRRQKE
jgi:hypothetical protein